MWRLVVVLVAVAVACGGSESSSEANPQNGGATTASVGAIGDDVLVGVMQATIGSMSAMADIGNQRVSNTNVRAFVAQLRTDATNAGVNLTRLAAGAGIAPATSDMSTEIAAASQAQITALTALADTQFDEGFVESVDQAQSTAAASFATQFVGASGNSTLNAFASGLARALQFEAGFANALQGDFDASAFLAQQLGPGDVPTISGAGNAGGGQLPPQTTAPAAPPTNTPSNPTTPNTINNNNGSGNTTAGSNGTNNNGNANGNTGNTGSGNAGNGSDMGSPGVGSGSGQGLGGTGTATGSGQDPGSGVGTGVSTP